MTHSTLALTLNNDLSAISRSAEAIEDHGRARGWPTQWIANVNLSIDELVSNLISYGYRNDEKHEILVTLTENDEALVVVLEDDGVAFDPFTDAPEPDLESGVGERELTGLGVHFVKSFIDDTAYERRDGRNRNTLILRRPGSPPPSQSTRRAPGTEESAEMEALARMTERDMGVAALDPLGLDDVFRALVGEGTPNVGEAERRFRVAAQHTLEQHWSREQAMAALRDLGMMAATFEQRYAIHPCESDTVAAAMVRLGELAEEVPRETVYAHGPRNPAGSRMRTNTTRPEERILYLSISKAARCLPECIRSLHKATSAQVSDVAEHLMQATMALESFVSALVRVKRTMPPAVFSVEIQPFFPEREVAGKRYDGPNGAQLGLTIVDRMLFGAEVTTTRGYETFYLEMIPYLPHELRGVAQRQRDRTSLLDMARDEGRFDHASIVCLRELFQVLYKFRVPHLRLAQESFLSRPEGATGSGGYDPGFLEMLANCTRKAVDELSRSPTPRHDVALRPTR